MDWTRKIKCDDIIAFIHNTLHVWHMDVVGHYPNREWGRRLAFLRAIQLHDIPPWVQIKSNIQDSAKNPDFQ